MKYTHLLLAALFITVATPTALNTQAEDIQEPDKKTPAPFDQAIYNWMRTFAEVIETVQEKHFKIKDTEKCMIGAINGFLQCLDPHSSLLDPDTYKEMLQATSGEFFGIGVVIDNTRDKKDKILLVIDTIADGPAHKAGMRPLDKIVEIDGKPLEGMTTEKATTQLKGKRGTKVNVKVMREGKDDLLSFDIERDRIKDQNSLSFHLPEQNMYYLSLNMFTESAMSQIESLLNKSKKQKYKGLILDLRNNSGGLLTSAVDIAGLFLDKGSIVVATKDKEGNVTESYKTTREPVSSNDLPIIILTNNFTASAAEILAGCLQLHSQELANRNPDKPQQKLMVFLVGTRTFGKGSVQEVIPSGNNSAMKITTSLYYLPNNTTIQGLGIEPDFVIEKQLPPTEQMKWFRKHYGRESTLTNSIKQNDDEEDATKKEEEKQDDDKKSWSERAKQALNEDNQFRHAITLINTLATIKELAPETVNTRTKAVATLKKLYTGNDDIELVEVKK